MNDPSTHTQLEMKKVRSAFGGQCVTLEDLQEAEMSIIRYAQQQRFKEEIDALSAGKSAVRKESPIYKLDPRMEDGLLRVGGRLSRAALPEETRRPLVLSKDQHISTLILMRYSCDPAIFTNSWVTVEETIPYPS